MKVFRIDPLALFLAPVLVDPRLLSSDYNARTLMALASGTKLGPYEIISLIGAGGMGEVYRVRDSRLGRDAALKILPESFAREDDRLRRFEQEARAVAALNHPNILAVFDIGQHNGAPFLVSELLEGESLREVLDAGALPQRKAIDYGVHIAHGLAAAHEKGIIHRDLKPENVFVTKDGRIKILDFGLAKLAQTTTDDPDGITLTGSHTAAGVVMGTAAYMAPEQVRGAATDPRTDIFAFGAVLYEMLTGVRAFRRDTPAETMTAVLKEEPPELSAPLRPIPPALERIVRRCLEKNPEQRFQSARDLSFALSALSGTDASGPVRVTAAPPRRIPLLLWVCVGLALVAVSGVTWWIARRPLPTTRLQFALAVPDEMSISHMALSSDGSMLVFVSPEENSALPMLYTQRVGSSSVTLLPGTQGASYPFWSPDSAYVGFFANGKLQKIAVAGGTTQVLASRSGWTRRELGKQGRNHLFSGCSKSAATHQSRWDGNSRRSHWESGPLTINPTAGPFFFPTAIIFYFGPVTSETLRTIARAASTRVLSKLRKENLSSSPIRALATTPTTCFMPTTKGNWSALLLTPLLAAVSGSTSVVANAVGFQPSTYWAAFTVAQNGTLIYNTGVGAAQSELTWMDRSGKELGRIGDPGVMANPTLSPDGTRVAVDISDQKANNVDIWIESTTGAANSRFTFDPSEEVVGVWSRDGSMLAYRIAAPEGTGLYLKSTTGLEREKKRYTTPKSAMDDILANSWSLDDRQILCTRQTSLGDHLELLPADSGEPTRFLTTTGNTNNGQISPDGKWVAYASDESGNWEIYVTSFPGAAGKWQVSRGGGTEPRWRGDGKEIFYISPSGTLMAVSVNGETTFATGTPAMLFQVHGRAPISSTDIFTYDVAKDGKRFLVNRYVKPEHIPPLTILLETPASPSSR